MALKKSTEQTVAPAVRVDAKMRKEVEEERRKARTLASIHISQYIFANGYVQNYQLKFQDLYIILYPVHLFHLNLLNIFKRYLIIKN